MILKLAGPLFIPPPIKSREELDKNIIYKAEMAMEDALFPAGQQKDRPSLGGVRKNENRRHEWINGIINEHSKSVPVMNRARYDDLMSRHNRGEMESDDDVHGRKHDGITGAGLGMIAGGALGYASIIPHIKRLKGLAGPVGGAALLAGGIGGAILGRKLNRKLDLRDRKPIAKPSDAYLQTDDAYRKLKGEFQNKRGPNYDYLMNSMVLDY